MLKVERPGIGDETRGWGPPFDANGASAYFLSVNRNKLSIALDFDDPGDRSVLHRLIADADVVVENFRPGTLERRGVSALDLLRRDPELLWCRLIGFGDNDEIARRTTPSFRPNAAGWPSPASGTAPR